MPKNNSITFEDCKKEIAMKYQLGKNLVIGHLPKYYEEAAELYLKKTLENIGIKNHSFYHYDNRGVKAFVRMNEYNGCYKIEAYRKLTDTEKNMISKKENINRSAIWNMVRVGIIKSFDSRIEAENAALELCESICKEFNM